MAETLIRVEGLSKKFCRSLKKSLWYGMKDIGSELLGRRHGADGFLRPDEFWAVKDISFELKRGECLGLIGQNGAGKSTLLKMLNGLIKPDSGRISMRGRVEALIELGAGFNPILTARENIYVNGAVLGLVKKEIDQKFDAIVDFAEIEEFIDTPVQSFSSGMKVRLGFAVAAQMEPDVLIIDEVLAVGDAGFRAKCLNRMSELSSETAMIFVSHSMPLIARMASSILSIQKGTESYLGQDIPIGIENYQQDIQFGQKRTDSSDFFLLESLAINSVTISDNQPPPLVDFGSPFQLTLKFRAIQSAPRFMVNIAFIDIESKGAAECFSVASGFLVQSVREIFQIELKIEKILLNPGRYYAQIALVEHLSGARRGRVLFFAQRAALISVIGDICGYAPVHFLGDWSYED